MPVRPIGARQYLAVTVGRVHAQDAALGERAAELERQQVELDEQRAAIETEREALTRERAACRAEHEALARYKSDLDQRNRKREAVLREAADILEQRRSAAASDRAMLNAAGVHFEDVARRLQGLATEIGMLIGADVRTSALEDALAQIERRLADHRAILDEEANEHDDVAGMRI